MIPDSRQHSAARIVEKTDFRQRVRHFSAWQPGFIQKRLRNWLWNSDFKHMHHVPPEIGITPAADGPWKLLRRGGREPLVSRPLWELENSSVAAATLVATGPSAKDFDWPSLKHGARQIWAVNGAPTLLASHGLHCDFLVITDRKFAREGADHIELAARLGARLLFSYEAAAGFAAERPDVLGRTAFHVFEKVNEWYALPRIDGPRLAALNDAAGRPFLLDAKLRDGVGWSRQPGCGVFPARTVAFAALQLMVGSGLRDIEIVGLDLGGKVRAYQENAPAPSFLERDRDEFILPAFDCMAAALAGSGIRITNLSEVSPLPRDLVPAGS